MLKKLEQLIQKYNSVFFWIFSTLPFFIADFVLRYKLNPMVITTKYSAIPILFSVFWIVLFVYLCLVILPEKLGKITYIIIVNLFGAWFFANFICFKILSRFLWIEDIFLAGEASNYISSALTYITPITIIVILIYLISIIIAYHLWEKPCFRNKKSKFIPLIICIIGLFSVQAFMVININKDKKAGAWEVWEKPTLVYDKFEDSNKSLNVSGFYQYTLKNLYRMITRTDENLIDTKTVMDYFENKEISDNEMTGLLKGKNIIFVLMESMDDWVINKKYTPTIKYMMDNGINFTNHYMPNVGMGYTFNAEFAANTGYYCPTTESSATIYTKNTFPYSLGNILKKEGYKTSSFHYNTRAFYNREVMHKRMGYDKYVSFMDYLSLEKCVQDSEAVKNDEIYKMMTETNEGENFLDFVITYSAHLPYNIEDNKLIGAKNNYENLIDKNLDEELRNLYILAHDTDEFFRILLKKLENDGILEDTVIIGFTDHYAYGLQDTELLKESSNNEILEKVPFFIYSPGLKHIEVNKVTSTLDILPTILNLMGENDRRYVIGSDAFDDNYKGLVYFPDGRWFDGKILFNQNEKAEYSEEEKEYILKVNEHIEMLKTINNFVISSNYFARQGKD